MLDLVHGALRPPLPGEGGVSGRRGRVLVSVGLRSGCCGRRVCFSRTAQSLLHGSRCEPARVATGTGFCFCFYGKLFDFFFVFFFFFLSYFVLWYFSSLGIIFNSKTGLTAVAFLFHLFLSKALKYLLKSAISDFSSFLLRQGGASLLFNPQKKQINH